MSKIPIATGSDSKSGNLSLSKNKDNATANSLDNIFENIFDSTSQNLFITENVEKKIINNSEKDLLIKNNKLSEVVPAEILSENTDTNNIDKIFVKKITSKNQNVPLTISNDKKENIIQEMDNDISDPEEQNEGTVAIFNFFISDDLKRIEKNNTNYLNQKFSKKKNFLKNQKNTKVHLNNYSLDTKFDDIIDKNNVIKKANLNSERIKSKDFLNYEVINKNKLKTNKFSGEIDFINKNVIKNKTNNNEQIFSVSKFKNEKLILHQNSSSIDTENISDEITNEQMLKLNNSSQNNNNIFSSHKNVSSIVAKEISNSQTNLKTFSNLDEKWLDLIDLNNDDWTNNLLEKIEKKLLDGKNVMEFELRPKNLGKLKVAISMSKESTNIQMKAETLQVAQIINDTEYKLSQMFENSGIKLGFLNTSAGNSQNMNPNNKNFGNQKNKSELSTNEEDNLNVDDTILDLDKNIVNIKA